MGCCCSISRRRRSIDFENGEVHETDARQNVPLKPVKPKWKSDIPLTEGQLNNKREEFWDTAPAFEGRKEIWDALKAAAHALDTNDYELAQAIVDGANITLPNGTLLDAYDELGNRYSLPIYTLSAPTNLIDDSLLIDNTDGNNIDNYSSSFDGGHDEDGNSLSSTSEKSISIVGVNVTLKLRLSTTNADVKLPMKSKDSIYRGKRLLEKNYSIPISSQRWLFSGKVLMDKMRIEDIHIPKGFIIQVIICDNKGGSGDMKNSNNTTEDTKNKNRHSNTKRSNSKKTIMKSDSTTSSRTADV